MSAVKDPSLYAKLPAGTRFLWGAPTAETAALKLLKDADAIGATGETAGFTDATRLIDTSKKSINDLPEGPEKEFVFLDDVEDTDLQSFLDAAQAKETVKVRIEYPNGRWAEMIIVLAGWEHRDLDKGQPMKLGVKGKQNSINRGKTTPAV